MPNEKSPNFRARLGVEALEAREVPATFGAGTRGLSIAFGDVIPVELDNGQAEYITGTGPGRVALVRIWDAQGKLLVRLNPFGNYTGGVFVDTGDVNGDGQLDLIVSTAGKTSGRVQAYSFINGGPQLLADFMPFGAFYTGPVQIASGNVTGGPEEEIIAAQGNNGGTVKVFFVDSTVSQAFQIRSFTPYGAAWTGGVTVASDDIHNNDIGGFDQIITGRASQLPQVKIFDAQDPTVVQLASYMAFNINNPLNLHGIDVAAGNTDGVVINNIPFLTGAEIFVSLRNRDTIRVFHGDTGAIITTIQPSQLFPPNFSSNINLCVGFANATDEFNGNAQLVVVAGDGPYEQHPVVFPGKARSAAGLNGSHPA